MDNMQIYNFARVVPDEAKKKISGGKLNGMTDINPMWRIEKLTELFGPCGIGWWTENEEYWTEDGANGEKLAFCKLALMYRIGDGNDLEEDISFPVYGVGGATMVAKTKNGMQSSDECYKMARTDAISVCCKMLGFGASVYWERGESKYSKNQEAPQEAPEPPASVPLCSECKQPITDTKWPDGTSTSARKMVEQTIKRCGVPLCGKCYTLRYANGDQGR